MSLHPAAEIKQPSMMEAFWYWLKLGFISFGGPAGQIAIMHHDLVEKKRWISDKRFLHALNYCMVLPGPEAQQLATYIGWLMHRTWGGVMAGSLFVLPSLFILIAISWVYMAYGHLPLIEGIFSGIKPAVVAIVLFAAYRLGSRALKNPLLWAVCLLALLSMAVLKWPFALILGLAATIGYLANQHYPQYFHALNAHSLAQKSYGKALIDDDTPTPMHAEFSKTTLVKWLVIGLAMWLLAIAILLALYGWAATFTQMGLFFTKAALLTFGGAYAVLPYVYHGAVEHYQWLTPAQMMDGLALGEATPGPLIMVVAFVGFVGGWAVNTYPAWLSGTIAACIVTFFTFLPSFIFILMGGPLIESSKTNINLTAPLTAITAAVVGVIINLALFFAYHVFWLSGTQQLDWLALVLSAFALLLLIRYKLSVLKLIAIFAALGIFRHYLNI